MKNKKMKEMKKMNFIWNQEGNKEKRDQKCFATHFFVFAKQIICWHLHFFYLESGIVLKLQKKNFRIFFYSGIKLIVQTQIQKIWLIYILFFFVF